MVKDEVLQALEACRGARLSGGKLAEKLGVSRAAIWKAVESLRTDGLQIDAAPGGYCLDSSDDSLTEPGIAALLHTKCLGHKLLVMRQTDSTNTALKQDYADQPEGFTLLAQTQTAGRGRLGRSFYSPPGGGLYMSVLLRPQLPLAQFNLLTLAAAVAVCRAINACCGLSPTIKWVNDILLDGKKLCGILTEAAVEGETGAIHYAIVGIGVNLRLDHTSLPDALRPVAGALADFTSQVPRRAALAAAILEQLERTYACLSAGQTAPILDAYRAHLCYIDQPIRVLSPSGAYEAICRGINDQGNLLIERPDGTRDVLQSGEISTRPVC